MIDDGAALGCPAIIGSLQGFTGGERSRAEDRLAEALEVLGAHARQAGQVLLYEPLNRYESDLFHRQADAAAFLRTRGLDGVELLADLFHMNLEEADLAEALRSSGDLLGHVHLADSNRGPAGAGHTDFDAIGAALREIGYEGWLSAEAFPVPTSERAAEMTLEVGRKIQNATDQTGSAEKQGGPGGVDLDSARG
jgi:sugar phosphate isomerase/epimerase